MPSTDRPLFQLDITEDATTGMSIRLRHAGRIPNVLAGISPDVLRRARPWVWSSYERRVLSRARSMSRQSYRLIRDTLILERAKMIMAEGPRDPGARSFSPARVTAWWRRRRLWKQHKAWLAQEPYSERVTRSIGARMDEAGAGGLREGEGPVRTPTLSEMARAASGTALATPRKPEPRDRSR